MGAARRATSRVGTKTAAKRTASRTTSAKKAASNKRATSAKSKPTLASIAAQLEALREQVDTLTALLTTRAASPPAVVATPKKTTNGTTKKPKIDVAAFENDLLGIVAELDRSARLGGMIPIPDVRKVFVDRGWTRAAFDERLLEAERDFVVDLKSANDPSLLPHPELAIEQPGRGHLQWVVTR